MMTLEEAINHAREVAEKNRKCQEENTIILSNRWISSMCCAEEHEQLAEWLEELKRLREKSKRIPCSERLPEDESYILVSFENSTMPDIARYEENDEGGTFYPGDDEKSYSSYGFFINAWMPLPKPYREVDDEKNQ